MSVPMVATEVVRERLQAAVDAIIKQLRHESDRLVPDVCAFSRGAESLLALVAALE
ncbi:MAG: hypothetical protein ABUS79_22490 [Pseudomonadota bacterium]